MSNQFRPTWAEINLDHLAHNFDLAQHILPNKIIIPVIKANAYGHGAIEVMRYLYQKGIRIAAVSLLEEALELRAHFKDIEILMMGPILPEDLIVASKNDIDITIYDIGIYHAVKSFDQWIKCHIKVDTGMSRYGLVETSYIVNMIEDLQTLKHVSLKGIYTHFSTANEDEKFYHQQLSRFEHLLQKIKTKPPMIHISNSASTFKYEQRYRFTTHVRLGISLYGLSLDVNKPDLRSAMSLKTKVIQIKSLKQGDCVGYGASYCVTQDEKIAILPIGYADGFIRAHKHGHVEIHQRIYKIVGIICMDACFVQVDEHVHVGDVATLFGGLISIDDVANRLKTINYEVCTSITYRVPRIYIQGGKND